VNSVGQFAGLEQSAHAVGAAIDGHAQLDTVPSFSLWPLLRQANPDLAARLQQATHGTSWSPAQVLVAGAARGLSPSASALLIESTQLLQSLVNQPSAVALKPGGALDALQRSAVAYARTPPLWLDDASAGQAISQAQRDVIVGLLRQRQIDPSLLSTFDIDLFGIAMRGYARSEFQSLTQGSAAPMDVQLGYRSRQEALSGLRSFEAYAQRLAADSEAFNRIASNELMPKVRYNLLALGANNRGVLKQDQLNVLSRWGDPEAKRQMAQTAFQTFMNWMVDQWGGDGARVLRPELSEFANFLGTPKGRELFNGIWNPDAAYAKPGDLRYKARVLDFLTDIDQRLLQADRATTPEAKKIVLQTAERDLRQQIGLIQQRGLRFAGSDDPALVDMAKQLMNATLGKVQQALGRIP
jgi:hypothetical protein